MSVWIVQSRRALSLTDDHVASALRSQSRHGSPVSQDAMRDALWATRALPVALDVMTDMRAGFDTTQVAMAGVKVERRRAAATSNLVAMGLHASGSAHIEVRFVDAAHMTEGEASRDACAVVVDFSMRADDTERNTAGIVMTRFSHGKTPSMN